MEIKHNFVIARRNLDGTQQVVHAAHLYGFAIHSSRPAGIIYFGEHYNATLFRRDVIVQFVRFVFCQFHRTVAQRRTFKNMTELLIGYGCMLCIQSCECGHFLIGAFHEFHVVDKPTVAIGMVIACHHQIVAITRKNNIFHVKHVQNRTQTVCQ